VGVVEDPPRKSSDLELGSDFRNPDRIERWINWRRIRSAIGALAAQQDRTMQVEISFESWLERRWENRLVGTVGLGLPGGELNVPTGAGLGQMDTKPHAGKVLLSCWTIREEPNHEAVAKQDGSPSRRPFGRRFGLVHHALAKGGKLVDRPQT
jgi:hypothetical protein